MSEDSLPPKDGDDEDKVIQFPGTTRKPTIRPENRDTKNARFKSCSCFDEIDRRLRLGWSAADCARAIQGEFKELPDLAHDSVYEMVLAHVRSIPPADLGAALGAMTQRKAIQRMNEGLDELQELERLYRLQMKRIDVDVASETRINKLFQNTHKEVVTALKIINYSAQLKMDLGLTKRQIGTVEITGQLAADATERYGRDSVGKVLADPESRRKVLGMAERLFQLLPKAGIDSTDMAQVIKTVPPAAEVIESKISDPDPDEPSDKNPDLV